MGIRIHKHKIKRKHVCKLYRNNSIYIFGVINLLNIYGILHLYSVRFILKFCAIVITTKIKYFKTYFNHGYRYNLRSYNNAQLDHIAYVK